MKFLFLSSAFVAATIVMFAADAPVVTGKWKLHNSVAGNESDMNCTFTQKEGDLTGVCEGEQGPVNITGKVDGKNVNWVYKGTYNGSPITLTYKGAVDEKNTLNGSLTVEEFGVEGTFSASQAQ
jgi:hypothetical protein